MGHEIVVDRLITGAWQKTIFYPTSIIVCISLSPPDGSAPAGTVTWPWRGRQMKIALQMKI
jgi:hypothetical protein